MWKPATRLLVLLALVAALAGRAAASLDRLRSFQKECFPALACVMILDKDTSYGCGQCAEDSILEEVSEILQVQSLINFLEAGSVRRFLLIPQILFFRPAFLNVLPVQVTNIAGVIVYDGFPGDAGTSEDATTPTAISTDRVNPNSAFSLPRLPERDPAFQYNNNSAAATPAQFAFYPFNIFRVNATVASRIRKRVKTFSPDDDKAGNVTGDSRGAATSSARGGMSPTYVLQSNGRMFACPKDAEEQIKAENADTPAGYVPLNSKQCLKDRTCLPIGGQSVWSSLEVLRAPARGDVLAVTAPMDSTAFFHDIAQGAGSEVSSLATLMAVAEAVAAYRRGPGKGREMRRQPLYFAWNAQSWGFAGSSRFLQDVRDFKCDAEGDVSKNQQGCVSPYKPSLRFKDLADANWAVLNVAGLIDPQAQAGQAEGVAPPGKTAFYLHGGTDNVTGGGAGTEVRDAVTAAFGDTVGPASVPYLPPDASQSFAQLLAGVETVSLANYESKFTNRVYHSQFDNVSRIPPSRRQPLYDAAEGLTRTVIRLCFGDTAPVIAVKRATIDGFIQCLTSNWSATPCELSREYQGPARFESAQPFVRTGNYAGVFVPLRRLPDQNPSSFFKTDLVNSFLAYHNRFEEGAACTRAADCNDFVSALNANAANHSSLRVAYCSRGTCVASDTFMHDAYGTGIDATAGFGAPQDASNENLPQFEVNAEKDLVDKPPRAPQYTESYWDNDLGVCGLTEDSSLFGYSVLSGGIVVTLASLVATYLLGRSLLPKKAGDEDGAVDDEQAPIAV
jgi:hypothetical protein